MNQTVKTKKSSSRKVWWTLFIIVAVIVVAGILATRSNDNEVLNATKPFFGEMLIEYPEDLIIEKGKVEEIRKTKSFIKYRVTGILYKGPVRIGEFDVEMHENIKTTPMGKWVMNCYHCPKRINPPDDFDSEQYKKWHEIFEEYF